MFFFSVKRKDRFIQQVDISKYLSAAEMKLSGYSLYTEPPIIKN